MKRFIIFFLGLNAILSSCSDPSTIGSELLSGEDLNISLIDTVSLTAWTEEIDSIISVNASTNMLGVLDDPIFGQSTSTVFLNCSFGISVPDFTSATLDSIVLAMPNDVNGLYGDTLTNHKVQVFQLSQSIQSFIDQEGIDSITSNLAVPFETTDLLGEVDLVPAFIDSAFVYDPELDTVVLEFPQIRIRIDDSFGQQFIDDELLVSSDSIFREDVRGFAIVSTPDNSSFFSVNLNVGASLEFYYTKGDSPFKYEFDVGELSILNYEHDYSSTSIASSFGTMNPDMLYLQSMAGLDINVDLSSIKNLGDEIIINQANLEFYLVDQPDEGLYPPVPNILANYDNDGTLNILEDASIGLSSVTLLEDVFGGGIEDDVSGRRKYSINITNHVTDLLNGQFDDDFVITLTSLLKRERPHRSVINGFDGSSFEPKLKLTVTTNQ